MRSNKKYTNTTFTKRVDHEAGHASRKHKKEPLICEECDAFYMKGHWSLDETVLLNNGLKKSEIERTLCPACIQIKSGEPSGFVFIDGNFFVEHKDEIENLLENENEKAAVTNPLARIMEWKRGRKKLVVTTTNEHLAKHLGRSLNKAYGGDVRYDFSHENKLARVYWHRD